jgi:hypothetical protein
LSVRCLYKAGLKGEIDYRKLYFRYRKKTIVEATITNRFYLVLYIVSKKEKQVVFVSTEINIQNIEEAGS